MDVISWIQIIVTAPLFHFGDVPITILWLIQAIILLILIGLITRGSKHFLKQYLLVKLGFSEGDREMISTFLSLGLGAAGFVLVLQGLGLNIQSLVII